MNFGQMLMCSSCCCHSSWSPWWACTSSWYAAGASCRRSPIRHRPGADEWTPRDAVRIDDVEAPRHPPPPPEAGRRKREVKSGP